MTIPACRAQLRDPARLGTTTRTSIVMEQVFRTRLVYSATSPGIARTDRITTQVFATVVEVWTVAWSVQRMATVLTMSTMTVTSVTEPRHLTPSV